MHFEITLAYKGSEGTCLASSRMEASRSFVASHLKALRSFVTELLLLVSPNITRTSSACTLRWLAGNSDPFELSLFPPLTFPNTAQE